MSTTTPPQTATMTAMTTPELGSPEVLTEATVARPTPGPTEILVKVHAAGTNPVDWGSRASGSFGLWDDPMIIGWDVSGTVEAVGFGSSLYEVGDEVFGMPRFPHQAGAYAEYVVAPSRQFAPKPAELTHVEAAALPLVGLTAWQALVEVGKVEAGQRVLIHAAAGGLGHVAAQIAKAKGAYVIGTASAAKHDALRSFGVDEPIDYHAAPFEAVVSEVDLVLNTIDDDHVARSLNVVKDGGTIVSVKTSAGIPDDVAAEAHRRGVRIGFTLVEPDRLGLLALADLVRDGSLRPEIAATFPLTDVAAAHRLGELGRTTGKIVLEVVPEA
ncbi:MAG: NADP-dependent oxidoreductase [Solirubrobacteraceae bacterium]|nr:NADP-dependent oxidoreductase [Patulibacter sp.]